MPSYRLIVDLTTDRIIYFTDDASQSLTTDNHSVLATYVGDLPPGLYHNTCWSFIYRDKKIRTSTPKEPDAKPLLEALRSDTLAILAALHSSKVTQLFPPASSAVILSEAQKVLAGAMDSKWLELLRARPDQSQREIAAWVIQDNERRTERLLELEQLRRLYHAPLSICVQADQIKSLRQQLTMAFAGFSVEPKPENPAWVAAPKYRFSEKLVSNWEQIQAEVVAAKSANLFAPGSDLSSEQVLLLVRSGESILRPEAVPVLWGIVSKYPELLNYGHGMVKVVQLPPGTVCPLPEKHIGSRLRTRHVFCLSEPGDVATNYLQVNGERRAFPNKDILSFDPNYEHSIQTENGLLAVIFDSVPLHLVQ